MPRPEKWYEDFLKALSDAGCAIDQPASALLLKTVSDGRVKGVFEDGSKEGIERLVSGKADLKNLTPEQQDALYELVESGNLFFNPGAHPKNSRSFFMYRGQIKATAPVENVDGLFYSPTVVNGVNAYMDVMRDTFSVGSFDGAHDYIALEMAALPELYADPEEANARIEQMKLFAQVKYSDIPLTPEEKKSIEGHISPELLADVKREISFLYPGASLKELAASGMLVAGDGSYIDASGSTVEAVEAVVKAATSTGGILVKDLDNDVTTKLVFGENGMVSARGTIQSLPVDPDVKADTIKSLLDIANEMVTTKSKSPAYNELCQKMAYIDENLEKATFKDEFDKYVNEAAELADKYYFDHVGAKLKSSTLKRVDLTDRIRSVRDAAINGKVPSEQVPDRVQVMRKALAERFVKAYAIAAEKHSKNDAEKEKAIAIQTDMKEFNKAVSAALEDKSFNYLYSGDTPESLERLTKAVKESPAKIVKAVDKEKKDPTPERLERERFLKQVPPARTENYKEGPVTKEMLKDIRDVVQRASFAMSKNYGGKDFAAFQKEVAIAQIRLSRGNTYIDARKLVAELAQAADTYLEKKLGEPMGSYKVDYVKAAVRIRHMADALNEDKLPSSVMPAEEDISKEILASKLVQQTAKTMMKSKDPMVQVRGKTMVLDSANFNKQVDKVLKEEAFSAILSKNKVVDEIICRDPKNIESAFTKAEKAIAAAKKKAEKDGAEKEHAAAQVGKAGKNVNVKPKTDEIKQPSQGSVLPV